MLDPKLLRQDLNTIANALSRRGFTLDIDKFNALETERRSLQDETQALQATRNKSSKAIGQAKAKGEDTSALMADMNDCNATLKDMEKRLSQVQDALKSFQLMIPNLLDEAVPDGKDEQNNLTIKEWGEPTRFEFEPKGHIEIGESINGLQFEKAAKISGARFVVIQGPLARLQRALAQFMLDQHTQHNGYEEVYVPYLVHDDALYGTGQLPKFKEDQFTVSGDWNLTLIPTAEVPVANLHRDSVVDSKALPLKYVAQTPCFRSEAGSYGKDTRGMIRQHQFEKVELVQLVEPKHSEAAHQEILEHAEGILQALEIPYRVVLLCAGDTGFSAAKTFDIEVWVPGENTYREISSCSNTRDFQARRMMARYRNPETGKPDYLHTLNGSGLAVGRTLIAVMENYQQADGSIRVPEVLKAYMGGIERITPA